MYTLQSPITNSILNYLNCDVVQRGRIEQKVLIFSGLNIKVETGRSSPITLHWSWTKITHMIEDIILCLIVFFKALCD